MDVAQTLKGNELGRLPIDVRATVMQFLNRNLIKRVQTRSTVLDDKIHWLMQPLISEPRDPAPISKRLRAEGCLADLVARQDAFLAEVSDWQNGLLEAEFPLFSLMLSVKIRECERPSGQEKAFT